MALEVEGQASAQASETPTRAIALLALASFASAANLRVCDPLLPQIAGELGVTVGTAALTVMAFALAYGVFQVVVGPLSDARGRLSMVVLGSLWAGIATVISAGMPTLGPLALMRFLAGAGGAAVIPVAIAWIGDVVPYERRQAVLARYISGQILGIVFGQAAGGLLGDLIGWRATLVMLGVVHIAAGLLLLGEMRRLKVGMSAAGPRALAPVRRIRLRACCRTAWVRTVLISVFIEGVAMFGGLAYVGADLHQRFGLSLGVVGALLASFGAGALFYSIDGWHAWWPGSASRAWRRSEPSASLPATPRSPSCRGPGSPFPPSPSSASASTCCTTRCRPTPRRWRPRRAGLAVSLFAFMFFCGQSTGVVLGAPVMDRYGGQPIFLSAAVIVLAIAFWFRRQLVLRMREPG